MGKKNSQRIIECLEMNIGRDEHHIKEAAHEVLNAAYTLSRNPMHDSKVFEELLSAVRRYDDVKTYYGVRIETYRRLLSTISCTDLLFDDEES